MQAIVNVILYDFKNFIPDGYVKYEEQIVETGSMQDFDGSGCTDIADAAGCILLPGFVNAHHHSYAALGRGWQAKSSAADLLTMLKETWWKLDGMLGEEEIYGLGIYNAGEMIKNGITTVIEHHASGKMILGSLETLKRAMCEKMGMRGIFCFETSDRFPLASCIEENVTFAEKNQTSYTSGLFGMNACLSLSEESLARIEMESGDLPVHIHVGESQTDDDISREKYGLSPLERLEKHHLLKKGSILSHCICIGEHDSRILEKHDVVIAVNVTSNLNNGLGAADYKKLKKLGKRCLLGLDGHGMNFSKELKNFYYGMKQKYLHEDGIALDAVREMIESNAAYASERLGCRLGRLEPGYEADFVLCEYESPTPMCRDNMMEHYWNGILESYHPKDVWCRGKQLLKEYHLAEETKTQIEKLKHRADDIWKQF